MKNLILLMISFFLFNEAFSQKTCAFKVVISSNVDCTQRNVVGCYSVKGISKKLFRRKMNKIKLSGVYIECDSQKVVSIFSSVCKIHSYKLISIEMKKMFDNEDDSSRSLSLFFSYSKH